MEIKLYTTLDRWVKTFAKNTRLIFRGWQSRSLFAVADYPIGTLGMCPGAPTVVKTGGGPPSPPRPWFLPSYIISNLPEYLDLVSVVRDFSAPPFLAPNFERHTTQRRTFGLSVTSAPGRLGASHFGALLLSAQAWCHWINTAKEKNRFRINKLQSLKKLNLITPTEI